MSQSILRRAAIAGATVMISGLAFLAPAGASTANTSGPYDANYTGAPSMNGNGGGNATGRPLAGSVGNADNKNPQGQLPDAASDGNNGYECDGNNGIAKTNPAHTGCTPPSNPV